MQACNRSIRPTVIHELFGYESSAIVGYIANQKIEDLPLPLPWGISASLCHRVHHRAHSSYFQVLAYPQNGRLKKGLYTT